jgi:hypothetical protein
MKRLNVRFLLSVIMGLMVFSGLSDTVQAEGMDSEASDSVVISGGVGTFILF